MPRPKKSASTNDPVFLNAALVGLGIQKAKIEEQIQQVRAMLGRRGPGRPPASAAAAPAAKAAGGKRRVLSAAARKRIAAAQRKRWADYRKKKAAKEGA